LIYLNFGNKNTPQSGKIEVCKTPLYQGKKGALVTSILPENITDENRSANYVANFFKEHKIGQILVKSNFKKQKGFSCKELLQFLVTLVFLGKNLYRYLDINTGTAPFQKDAVYRFLNECHYNWRKFLLFLSSQIIRSRIVPQLSASDSLKAANRYLPKSCLLETGEPIRNGWRSLPQTPNCRMKR
jgi:hypothetical protein